MTANLESERNGRNASAVSADDSAKLAESLSDDNYLEAFAEGAAVWLVRNRNRHLGSLLNSEHREFYIQILHRMLHFRRGHELEPLNEDIYLAVKPALEKTSGEEYTQLLFNRHIKQLAEWELVIERLEKERLRGYRDVSRDRFRYRLADDTVSFLYWLEDRLRGMDDDAADDAGDILDFVLSRLKELGRKTGRIDLEEPDDVDTARNAARIVHLLYEVNDRTDSISRNLTETSAKMESFLLIGDHTVEEAQEIIDELRAYLSGYLTRVHELRRKILSELRKNAKPDRLEILNACFEIYARELRKAPRFMRRAPLSDSPERIIERLTAYYRQHGQLDSLCDRVNGSAMKVWGKLSSRLRELERKNNRCEAIAERVVELSRLPEDAVPIDFFTKLLSSAAMVSDPNYWDEFTKADPPQPRFTQVAKKSTTRAYIPRKPRNAAPALSMEDAKLKKLRKWIDAKFAAAELKKGVELDSANFAGVDDFKKIIELAKKGVLGKGRNLEKINLKLKVGANTVKVADERRELIFRETIIAETAEK